MASRAKWRGWSQQATERAVRQRRQGRSRARASLPSGPASANRSLPAPPAPRAPPLLPRWPGASTPTDRPHRTRRRPRRCRRRAARGRVPSVRREAGTTGGARRSEQRLRSRQCEGTEIRPGWNVDPRPRPELQRDEPPPPPAFLATIQAAVGPALPEAFVEVAGFRAVHAPALARRARLPVVPGRVGRGGKRCGGHWLRWVGPFCRRRRHPTGLFFVRAADAEMQVEEVPMAFTTRLGRPLEALPRDPVAGDDDAGGRRVPERVLHVPAGAQHRQPRHDPVRASASRRR